MLLALELGLIWVLERRTCSQDLATTRSEWNSEEPWLESEPR